MPKLLMRLLRFLQLGLVFLVGGLAVVWTAGALYFDQPAPALLRTIAAIAWTLAAALFGTFFGWRGRVGVLLAFLLILGWWVTLTPRQDRDWQPSVAKLAYATREGDHITVHDIRNFEYRSAADFTPRYDTREYNLANLHGLESDYQLLGLEADRPSNSVLRFRSAGPYLFFDRNARCPRPGIFSYCRALPAV
jgi:hypothetical protein